MKKYFVSLLLASACAFGAKAVPAPATDVKAPAAEHSATAVFAGGCFWGVSAVFEHVRGVTDVVSGFSGGTVATGNYELVSTGRTGEAESAKVTYDPSQVSYGQLLQVFFAVAHDPTELNYQGPDEGTQYRSAIFYMNDDQKRVAQAYIQQLTDAKVFKHKIVTQVAPFHGFYAAEEYHQHFLDKNPTYPYIVYNDLPKLRNLKKQFPDLAK